MGILSSLQPDVPVSSNKNLKNKLVLVLQYNYAKAGVDIFEHMKSVYSAKAGSRRWPVQVF